MRHPRLTGITFLPLLEQEQPTSLTVWEWAKHLGISQDISSDMVFALFRDGCLEGTSSLIEPMEAVVQQKDSGRVPLEEWGNAELLRSVKTLVVLTSSDEDQDIVRSYDLGANSFVRTPVAFQKCAEAAAQLGAYWLTLNEPSAQW